MCILQQIRSLDPSFTTEGAKICYESSSVFKIIKPCISFDEQQSSATALDFIFAVLINKKTALSRCYLSKLNIVIVFCFSGDQMYSGGNNFNCLAGADNFDFNKSKLMLPSSTIVSPQEASKEVSSVSKPETVEAVATTKTKTNDFKPKLIKKPPSKKVNQSKRKTIVGEGGVGVNMCTHCSRVFCSKRALDVHTFKMHGREYMQNPSHSWNTSPFTCWFCSAQFPSPELVVEHMTNSHENLDKLSKRVEEQNIQANAAIIQDKIPALKPGQSASKRYVSIASSKQMLPLPSLNTTQTAPKSSTNQQPPPGFKMSYALAYVPIFIPEKNESEENRD